MKSRITAFIIFLFGIFLFFFSIEKSTITFENSKIQDINLYENMKFFEGFEFLGIFLNNLVVGFFLSIAGYFTGGFLTILILIWNGFFVAAVYNIGFHYVSIDNILYASKHAPIEIYSFLIFSEFGFKGHYFMKKILKENIIDFTLIPKFKKLIYPVLLLFIASILETL